MTHRRIARFRIGVISDTHGLLRPEALAALRDSALIVHAGDIGSSEILEELSALAPVVAVRGNNDAGSWASALPEAQLVVVRGKTVRVIHDVADRRFSPPAARLDVVISGHSHRPDARLEDGVLFFNPGSAGPRRFSLPVTVGSLVIERDRIAPEIRELAVAPPKGARS